MGKANAKIKALTRSDAQTLTSKITRPRESSTSRARALGFWIYGAVPAPFRGEKKRGRAEIAALSDKNRAVSPQAYPAQPARNINVHTRARGTGLAEGT